MAVEAECYTLKRQVGDVLDNSASVPPGSTENLEFSKERKVGVVVFCDIDDTKGTVLLVGDDVNKKVSAVLFENESDDEGLRISAEGFLPIKEGQALWITLKRRPRKEITFYLEPGGDDDQKGEDVLEDSPAPAGVI
jgi:hypothetical protein